MTHGPPIPTHFPYTTLFPSDSLTQRLSRISELDAALAQAQSAVGGLGGGLRGGSAGLAEMSAAGAGMRARSEEDTSEVQSGRELGWRRRLEKNNLARRSTSG